MKDFFEEEAKLFNSEIKVLQEFNSITFKGHKLNIIADVENSKHGPRIKVIKDKVSIMELPLSKDNEELQNNKVIAKGKTSRSDLHGAEKEVYDIAKAVALQFGDRIIDFEFGKLNNQEGKKLNKDIDNFIIKNLKGKI